MKFSSRLLLGFLVAAMLLSACAVASRNALVGKWGNATQDLVLEFTMDGRLKQSSQGVTQELGYQFLDDNTIVLKVQASGSTEQPIPFKIAGDKLTLELGSDQAGQAQSLEFTRVK